MTIDNLACFGCGGKGHIERECPNRHTADSGPADKPMWCRRCDRRTRLIEVNGIAARCQECNPQAHMHLAHLIRCPGCRMLVYVWDNGVCGQHASPERRPEDRPEREEIAALITGELKRHDIEGGDI